MEKEVTISYNWSNNKGTEVQQNHQAALEESAMNRIIQMMNEGCTSGELHDTIRMDQKDGKDGIEYSGYWSINTKTIS